MEFKNLPQITDYEDIVLSGRQIIDVRAPIEFNKGSLPNAINIPLLNDEQREKIGIIYKKNGHEAAFTKGLELISGTVKTEFLSALEQALNEHPDSIVMCFRGGDRSKITQQWIYDHIEKTIPRIKGGFKAMRHYLMTACESEQIEMDFYLLAGHTGCGKTLAVHKCPYAIDLEGIANHRGSAFGSYALPQPTQINFEHKLAYQLIALKSKGKTKLILEKEGKLIGRNRLPESFYKKMLAAPIIVLESTLKERVDITYNDYVVNDLKTYAELYGNEGAARWQEKMRNSMENLQRRFGGNRTNKVIEIFESACQGEKTEHKVWIEILLNDYYDPMYSFQRSKWQAPVIFSGDEQAVLAFIESL